LEKGSGTGPPVPPEYTPPSQTPQPERRKTSPAVYVTVGIIVFSVIIALIFIVSNLPQLNPPRPEIISTNGYDGFQGLNYVLYIDVNVKNNGGSGYVIVYAEISGAGKYEKKESTIYLSSGQTQDVHFTFDVSFWGALLSQITYRAWAVPK